MENIAQLQLPPGVELFMFANYICIVSKGPNKGPRMQRALNTIANTCSDLGLKINTLKTKEMAMKTPTPSAAFSLQGEELQWVN